jgi:parallel beta-helix repeat protein
VQSCVCANNGRWGIFTDFADDLFLIGNECYGSVLEHGIYHSNSSDRGVLRGNYCHDNWSSGIQINADPSQGGDGISSDCVVDRNLLVRNGLGNAWAAAEQRSISRRCARARSEQRAHRQQGRGFHVGRRPRHPVGPEEQRRAPQHGAFKSGEGRYALCSGTAAPTIVREQPVDRRSAGALMFTPDSWVL